MENAGRGVERGAGEREKKVKKGEKEKEKKMNKTQEKRSQKEKTGKKLRTKTVCPGKGGAGGKDLVLSDGVANEEAVSWGSTNQEA